MPRLPLCLGTVLLVLGLLAPAALADGGPSISRAPYVAYGQQEFGNTANGTPTSCQLHSYWLLDVRAGDHVKIDWESQDPGLPEVYLYPIGTNDYTVETSDDITYSFVNNNGRAELVFDAPRTGVMPLDFRGRDPGHDCGYRDGGGGPYDFTAFVQHAIALHLPLMADLPREGTISVGTYYSDGAPLGDTNLNLKLQARSRNGTWTTVGHGRPSDGVATIRYVVPPTIGGRVHFRALAVGTYYRTTASRTETLAVGAALRHVKPNIGARVSRAGRIDVPLRVYDGSRVPDGVLKIDAQLKAGSRWETVGSAAVTHSVARIRLHIPRHYRHHHVTLRFRAHGDYPARTSRNIRVFVR